MSAAEDLERRRNTTRGVRTLAADLLDAETDTVARMRIEDAVQLLDLAIARLDLLAAPTHQPEMNR